MRLDREVVARNIWGTLEALLLNFACTVMLKVEVERALHCFSLPLKTGVT